MVEKTVRLWRTVFLFINSSMNSPIKKNPIGIFDSGTGGLTVANAICKLLPNEDIVYFGDIAHLPFGDKSSEAIKGYSRDIANFLVQKKCKAIVIACNTASAVAYNYLREKHPDLLIFNVIDPIVNAVVLSSAIKKVGVIGTNVTVESKIYETKLLEKNPDLIIHSKATRSLVPIIEEGLHHKKHLLFALLDNYLGVSPMNEIDGLILGCTHYPIIKEEIQHYFENKVEVFDAPSIVAKELRKQLKLKDLLRSLEEPSDHQFFVSDLTPAFGEMTALFFGQAVKLKKQIL